MTCRTNHGDIELPFKRVVGFLQNAWSPHYAGRTWPRHFWLPALMRSRTGQRLKVLLETCPELEFWWDETTPIVGPTPDSVVPPDLEHIAAVMRQQKPDVVITFGKQAEKAVPPFCDVPIMYLPHPAYRVVTNSLYRTAGRILMLGFNKAVRLTQKRGSVVLKYAD